MAGETTRRETRRQTSTIRRGAVDDAERAAERTAATATRIAAVLAFATLAASGASIHALVFWAAALFLIVRFGDLEGLERDVQRDKDRPE